MIINLRPVIRFEPDPEAQRSYDAALDLIADAIAEQLINEARAEIAAELGLDAGSMHREPESLTRAAQAHMGQRTSRKARR